MPRNEFSRRTKAEAFERSGGFCECCGLKLGIGGNNPEYDHEIPDGLGGTNDLENCLVLGAKCCHSKKTHEVDRPMMAKADRLRKKHNGIIKPDSALAAKNRWTPERRDNE